MTGLLTRAGWLLVALAPVTAWCDDLQLSQLLQQLARPAPAETAFLEGHFSALLSRALVVSGKLEYLGPDALARTVESPFHERSEVRGESVTIEREGQKTRHFSLARAPELRTLLASFASLLSGNSALLAQQFDITLSGGEQDWKLDLAPRDAHVKRRVRSIAVSGAGSQPRCIITTQANNDTTITLLGKAAEGRSEDADRPWFEARCAGAER